MFMVKGNLGIWELWEAGKLGIRETGKFGVSEFGNNTNYRLIWPLIFH